MKARGKKEYSCSYADLEVSVTYPSGNASLGSWMCEPEAQRQAFRWKNGSHRTQMTKRALGIYTGLRRQRMHEEERGGGKREEGRGRRRRRERRRRRNKKGSHLAEKEEVAKGPEEKQLEMLSTVKEAKKRQLELNIQ